MAHKNSEQISPGNSYQLGEYTFSIQNVVSEDERVIQAHVTGPEGSAAYGISVPSSNQVAGWYVEANEDTADVYAIIKIPTGSRKISDLDTGPFGMPVATGGSPAEMGYYNEHTEKFLKWRYTLVVPGALYTRPNDGGGIIYLAASPEYGANGVYLQHYEDGEQKGDGSYYPCLTAYTHSGRTVYYTYFVDGRGIPVLSGTLGPLSEPVTDKAGAAAWTMIYGTPSEESYETTEVLIGRFRIDLDEAGGSGDDSDWEDPDDWEDDDPIYPDDPDYPDDIDPILPEDPDYPDPEDPDYPGDQDGDGEPDPYYPPYYPPTHTLKVEITGALSGRHNDPLTDDSYSYIPAENTTKAFYGCGGNGGHGGGGGGGASTIVVYKFATSKADSKEIVASSRRHGYGSGGGKGGKGGDGCILIYY